MGNKDRDLYEKTGRFGSKNKMSAFISTEPVDTKNRIYSYDF